jgi:hypothetical protein
MRLGGTLDEPFDGLDSGRPGKLAELGKLEIPIDARSQHSEDESALGLGPRRGIRLAYCHALDYAR